MNIPKKNIILMGPPGAGKTSVGKVLAEKLNLNYFDVDDFLEETWKCTVGEKLLELGDEKFLEAEGEAVMKISVENSIISLTGSNPLHPKSMEHLRTLGNFVFLDTPKEIILGYLHEMKVDRIVGQNTKTLPEILDYRGQFYEKYYDLRIPVVSAETPEKIAEKVMELMQKNQIFESTRGFCDEKMDFLEVMQTGLSPDGGLFVPKNLPSLDLEELKNWKNLKYPQRAVRILEKFPLGKMTTQELLAKAQNAYGKNFGDERIAPISKLTDKMFLLELFHGPTASFKDMALQLTPKLFSVAMKKNIPHPRIKYGAGSNPLPEGEGTKFLILVATSGDTGIAAVEGFRHEKDVFVVVLFPENGVSAVQKQQMQTAQGENVLCVGVDGDFDFCQTTVKQIFNDENFQQKMWEQFGTKLSAANSMNWGRFFPQVAYFFSAYADLVEQNAISFGEKIDVCIPCGNFGNILGAFLAKKMGLPIEKFVAASNENNVLAKFLQTGTYDLRNKKMLSTDSPSIDILKSSNVERFLYWLSDGNVALCKQCFEDLETQKFFTLPEELIQKMQKDFVGDFATTEEMQQTVKKTLQQTGVLIDPHTAVAVCVAEKNPSQNLVLVASTAHFGKFLPAIAKVFDIPETHPEKIWEKLQHIAPNAKMHPQLHGLFEKEKRHNTIISAHKTEVENTIAAFLEKK